MDAGKLANLLRTGMLRPVYHGEHGLRTLRELARTYQTLSQDLNRVMNRVFRLPDRSLPTAWLKSFRCKCRFHFSLD